MKIVMPQLGETVTEGTVSAWHKAIGDQVEKDEALMDVETDKVATEIPAPISGVLTQILVAEGDTVDVGVTLAIIGNEDDESEPVTDTVEKASEITEPRERKIVQPGAGMGLSPAVRRLVAQHNINIDLITGTGRDGRITKQDVVAYVENVDGSEERPKGISEAEAKLIPFDRIRRITADHMVRSKATSPHVLQAIEADFSAVDAVRLTRKTAWKEKHGFSLSYLPFIARAVCQAIEAYPRINSSVESDALQVHSVINLAIAVDLNHEGLLAPVIRDAASLKVPELAMRINELVSKPEEKP